MNKIFLLSVLIVSACASGPGPSPVRQPIGQQAAVGEARARAKVRTELGTAYFQDKQYGTALDEARKAIQADGAYAPAFGLLGMIYMELDQNSAAEESFERALRLAPGDPDISNNFGWFLCQTGRAARSVNYFKAAIGDPLYRSPGLAMVNAGVCLVRAGDVSGAENYFQAALELDPANTRALFETASLYLRQGQSAKARQRISELHRLVEPTAESTWLAVRIAHALGDKQDEAAFMSILRRKFPASREAQLLQQGRFE